MGVPFFDIHYNLDESSRAEILTRWAKVLQPCFGNLGGALGDFPHAEKAATEVLALPIYPGVTADQREEVALGIETERRRS